MSSRSTPLSFKLTFAALALGASAAIATGCSTETASDAARQSPTAPLNDDTGSAGAMPRPTDDASPVTSSPYRGNPLCLVKGDDYCMPDDDAYHRTALAEKCAEAPPDAGDAGAADSFTSKGCRITRDKDSSVVAPTCSEAAALGGGDGASCSRGDDCAAGFDCIGGPSGKKSCRHYCCSGSCKEHVSQSGGATFCDVQSLVDVNQKAPVCMPLKRCKLLGTGECTADESCAIVTETGDTGCVTLGDQQVGASCDAEHCAANLTCLGKPGARKCFKLCKVSSNECGASQVCATSTVFKDPNFGICRQP